MKFMPCSAQRSAAPPAVSALLLPERSLFRRQERPPTHARAVFPRKPLLCGCALCVNFFEIFLLHLHLERLQHWRVSGLLLLCENVLVCTCR
ncbi:hypothetical protein CALCODRAFT_359389 [Calocera cornea HHB12733]|uniref:Uncharacterized protein n=1 Tax=Calocera cornea HHB12733 TaxID=1353952 RepID=A0A165ELX8_9BASI|nr:hypothetical protein CALCODRAFT_359389 [Calocera cornea HHB12733]